MTDEKKQEFTRKISQANETELMALTLEITYSYMEEAESCLNHKQEFQMAYERVSGCLTYLLNTVDLGSELGRNLFMIYQSVRKEMMLLTVKKDQKKLERSKGIIKKLADSFYRLSEKDSSKPIMENAEILYAGLTYTGRGLSVSSKELSANRGFFA